MSVEAKCPAAEIVHPVLSPNKNDAECRITGSLRPAQRKGKKAYCCDNYYDCPVWQAHKKQNALNTSVRVDQMQRARAPHTLPAAQREKVTVG